MIPNENPVDRAERMLVELAEFLTLIDEPRSVLKGYLVGHIMKRGLRVNKELLPNGDGSSVGDLFITESNNISLKEDGLFQHSNLEELALLMLSLDDNGTVIAGKNYVEESIGKWFFDLLKPTSPHQ